MRRSLVFDQLFLHSELVHLMDSCLVQKVSCLHVCSFVRVIEQCCAQLPMAMLQAQQRRNIRSDNKVGLR